MGRRVSSAVASPSRASAIRKKKLAESGQIVRAGFPRGQAACWEFFLEADHYSSCSGGISQHFALSSVAEGRAAKRHNVIYLQKLLEQLVFVLFTYT